MRVDTQTILTIHNSIITRNQRVSLSHREHKEWKLHISNAQEVDRGWYMCQVNTDPMRSRRGYLEVQGEVDSSVLHSHSRVSVNVFSAPQHRGRPEFQRPRGAGEGESQPDMRGPRLPLASDPLEEGGRQANHGQRDGEGERWESGVVWEILILASRQEFAIAVGGGRKVVFRFRGK